MADIPIIVAMRFSFWGASGWKSDFSREKELLFDADRLAHRFTLFRRIALASLAAQTDRTFSLYILSSDQMPGWAKDRLIAETEAALGPDHVRIVFEPHGRARKYLNLYLKKTFGQDRVAQVILDDDDGLSSDFMADLRGQLTMLDEAGTLDDPGLPHFVTHPLGYGLVLDGAERLYQHRYRFINLGLTMIGRPSHRSIFAIDHQNAPQRFGYTKGEDKPYFVRSVHGMNDSRVAVTEKWVEIPAWSHDHTVQSRFGWLIPKG